MATDREEKVVDGVRTLYIRGGVHDDVKNYPGNIVITDGVVRDFTATGRIDMSGGKAEGGLRGNRVFATGEGTVIEGGIESTSIWASEPRRRLAPEHTEKETVISIGEGVTVKGGVAAKQGDIVEAGLVVANEKGVSTEDGNIIVTKTGVVQTKKDVNAHGGRATINGRVEDLSRLETGEAHEIVKGIWVDVGELGVVDGHAAASCGNVTGSEGCLTNKGTIRGDASATQTLKNSGIIEGKQKAGSWKASRNHPGSLTHINRETGAAIKVVVTGGEAVSGPDGLQLKSVTSATLTDAAKAAVLELRARGGSTTHNITTGKNGQMTSAYLADVLADMRAGGGALGARTELRRVLRETYPPSGQPPERAVSGRPSAELCNVVLNREPVPGGMTKELARQFDLQPTPHGRS